METSWPTFRGRQPRAELETKYRDIADGNRSFRSFITERIGRSEPKYRDIADGNWNLANCVVGDSLSEPKYRDIADSKQAY